MQTLIWEQLDQSFHLTLEKPGEAAATIGGEALLDRVAMSSFLDAYMHLIEGKDRTVAAAYFSSWFGNVAAALHYSVSVHHAAPDFSLANLNVHLIPEEGYTRLGFQFLQGAVDCSLQDTAGRTVWQEHIFTRFYGLTARPLMECLAAASGLNIGLIWGQLPTSLQNYREHFLELYKQEDEVWQQYAADEHFVQAGLNAGLFGRAKNPLQVKVRKIDHPLKPGEQLAIKNVCCLQYCRQGRTYCYTCPRLTKKDRDEWQM